MNLADAAKKMHELEKENEELKKKLETAGATVELK